MLQFSNEIYDCSEMFGNDHVLPLKVPRIVFGSSEYHRVTRISVNEYGFIGRNQAWSDYPNISEGTSLIEAEVMETETQN